MSQCKKRPGLQSKIVHGEHAIEAMIHVSIAGFGYMIASVFRSSAKLQHVNQASQAAPSAFEEVTG